jgi:hypothetical protein
MQNIRDKLKKVKIAIAVVVILAILAALATVKITHTQASSTECRLEILGGSSNMYPGQHVVLFANNSGQQMKNYTWSVEGPILKDYDDNVYNSTYLTAFLNIDPPTYMSALDFKNANLSFYWQPNNTDTTRTVSLNVETENNQICKDSRIFNVAKNTDNITLQAEDFFVEQNHPVGFAADGRNETRVLRQHEQWHVDQRAIEPSYSKKGSVFFDFHRLYLAHFDAWRDLFGYPKIVAWDPTNIIPTGVEINHTNRNQSAEPLELPSWFNYQTGAEGLENRTIVFVRSFPGQDQLPQSHPLANSNLEFVFFGPIDPNDPNIGRFSFLNGHTLPMCEEMDYPQSSSGYPLTQNALNDFAPDQILLGCALTNPFHDDNHGELAGETGDMGDIEHSPRDPLFWRFHKFVDSISVQRFFPPIVEVSPTDVSDNIMADSFSPQIISQNPFRHPGKITSLPNITENEKGLFGMTGIPAISAQFSEPVTGIKPSDFKVNGSPATQVKGIGSGPYVFVGFETPEIESSNNTIPINVTLSSGNITDIVGNRFQGSSWNYTLVRPDIDQDNDGLKNSIEIESTLTDPAMADSDGDTLSDGTETISKCLNPLVNDKNKHMHMVTISDLLASMNMNNATGLDYDKDSRTNIEEVKNNTDPCSANSTF